MTAMDRYLLAPGSEECGYCLWISRDSLVGHYEEQDAGVDGSLVWSIRVLSKASSCTKLPRHLLPCGFICVHCLRTILLSILNLSPFSTQHPVSIAFHFCGQHFLCEDDIFFMLWDFIMMCLLACPLDTLGLHVLECTSVLFLCGTQICRHKQHDR